MDEKLIIDYYINKKKSMSEIAKIYSVDYRTIKNILYKNNICISNKKIKEEDIDDIKKMIKSEKSIEEIANIYNINKTTLYRFIKKNKIQTINKNSIDRLTKEIIDLYNNKVYSMQKIANLYNLDERRIKTLLEKNNIFIRNSGQIYNYDINYFEEINSEYKAYFLGLLTSDGNLTESKNTVQINLQEGDRIVLDLLLKDIVIGEKEKKLSYIFKPNSEKNQYKLTVNNKKIFNDLKNLGLEERKSLTIEKLCTKIPEEFYKDYIRGLFDGDGTVFIDSRNCCKIGYYSGSEKFLENYKNFCIEKLKMSKNKTYHGTSYFTTWSKLIDIRKFYNYIYKNSTIYIPRKYYKFLEIFKIKNNTDKIYIPKKILF